MRPVSISVLLSAVSAALVHPHHVHDNLTTELFPQGPPIPGREDPRHGKPLSETVYGYKYGVETHQIEAELAENMMDIFVGRLRGFVNDTNFDTVAFESQASELGEELSLMARTVAKIDASEEIAHQLGFARHAYQVMLDSSRIMKLYSNFDYPGHRLVYNVLELSVRALALNNSHGALDLHVGDYLGKLVRLYHNLNSWVGKFRVLSYVPWGTRQLFQTSVREAEKTLEDLRTWVPI